MSSIVRDTQAVEDLTAILVLCSRCSRVACTVSSLLDEDRSATGPWALGSPFTRTFPMAKLSISVCPFDEPYQLVRQISNGHII